MSNIPSTAFAVAALAVYCSAWVAKGARREALLALAFGLESAALLLFPRS